MRGFFCTIAGVDPAALDDCPHTDRIWASHLGFSLVLNFVLIFGLTLYSVSYFIPELYTQVIVASVVAAIVTMFDRALFQSDWFTIALMQKVREPSPHRQSFLQRFLAVAHPACRLSLRLLISLAIAYTLSVFAELAVFDSAIRERMMAENYSDNGLYREKLSKFERGLDEDRAILTRRIDHLKAEIDSGQSGFVLPVEQQEFDALRKREVEANSWVTVLEGTIADNEKRIRELNEDIYSERYGLKDKPHRTGKPGCEPGSVCNELVVSVRELREANARLRPDIERAQARAQELGERTSELLKRRSTSGSELIATKRKDLEVLQAEALTLEKNRIGFVAAYDAALKSDGTYQPLRDDPMIRIGVLDALSQDPVKGPAVSKMSFLIKVLIAFLELAPVLAKIFFAPPTAYSAKIRAAVALGQSRAQREVNNHLHAIPNIDIYGSESKYVGVMERAAPLATEQLTTASAKLLETPAPTTLGRKPLRPVTLEALNDIGVSKLREWLERDSQRIHGAGDYYTSRLAEGKLLLDSDLAIADYSRRHFGRQTRFFELGFGFGELSLCLALCGFRTVGFESDASRYAGASALAAALTEEGVDITSLSLDYGVFPDVFRLNGPDLDSESVFVSTNVTSSLMMEMIDRILRALSHFDHLIIDLSRFGEVRAPSSQRELVVKLQEVGFREVARVFSAGDTDIRHFHRRPWSVETPSGRVGTEPV